MLFCFRQIALRAQASDDVDVIITEIGGTVGDIAFGFGRVFFCPLAKAGR